MADFDVTFNLDEQTPITADFSLEEPQEIEADFHIIVGIADHNILVNRELPDQHPISAITGLENALETKVEKTNESNKVYGTNDEGLQTTYDLDSFGRVNDVLVGGVSVVTNKIAELGTMAGETASDYSTKAVADTLYAAISFEGTIDNHIANKNNPHDVTKAQVGLGNVDNTSDLNKPISTATQTALNGKQATISDLETIRSNAQHGESAYNTISGYGTIVTHDADEFATAAQGALADTALQPNDNISELNNDVGYITGITSSDVTNALGYTPYNSTNPSGYQDASDVASAVAVETGNREAADNNLQSQIDAITAASDVTDIVGTYAELQAYDTTSLPNNSIIKVLQDESRDDETTYYRWVITGGVGSWVLIGEEGPYYTKSEADSTFVPQTRTVNNKALSSNITLTASDVGALPSSTTIGNGTLTIQKNGTSVQTFTANQTGNVTANITVPTDTSDLTNGAGFITSSALSGYQTTANLVTSVSSSSTDSQYPSAKCVYDIVGDIESTLNAIRGV